MKFANIAACFNHYQYLNGPFYLKLNIRTYDFPQYVKQKIVKRQKRKKLEKREVYVLPENTQLLRCVFASLQAKTSGKRQNRYTEQNIVSLLSKYNTIEYQTKRIGHNRPSVLKNRENKYGTNIRTPDITLTPSQSLICL